MGPNELQFIYDWMRMTLLLFLYSYIYAVCVYLCLCLIKFVKATKAALMFLGVLMVIKYLKLACAVCYICRPVICIAYKGEVKRLESIFPKTVFQVSWMVERHVAHEGHIRVIWYRSRDHLNTEVFGCLKCQDLCVCSWTTQMHFQQLFPLSVSSTNRAYQEIILRDALCLHDFSFLLHQSVHPLSSSLTVVRIYKMGSLAFLSFILLLLDFFH